MSMLFESLSICLALAVTNIVIHYWGVILIALLSVLIFGKLVCWYFTPVLSDIHVVIPHNVFRNDSDVIDNYGNNGRPMIIIAQDNSNNIPINIRKYLDRITEPIPIYDLN